MPLERSLSEVFGAHSDVLKHEIRKIAVATVTAVYPDRQTVDVQLAVNNPTFDDLGNVYMEAAPGLSDVPLVVMRGGGFFIWMPVAVGDSVLVVFSDVSTDTWRAGNGTPAPPGWVGHHTMDSPFAIPAIAPDMKFFADPNNDPTKIIIGKDGQAAQIRISATDIELGNAVTDAVALASKVTTALNDIVTWVQTGVAPAGTAGGPVVFSPPSGPTLPSVASTLVKAQ